jgi:hypothetical protein
MKAVACIPEFGRDDNIVEVSDISRGGVSFRGGRAYQVNSWIQFAVPTTPDAANIFVSGRIAGRKDPEDDKQEHGVQYVRGQAASSLLRYFSTSESARDSASSNTATP